MSRSNQRTPQPRWSVFLSLAVAILVLICLTLNRASAATRTWDGGGIDANWDTITNWNNNALPANGDTIVFATAFTSGTGISLNGNRTIATLSITNTTGFSLNNNILTITSGDITRSAASGTTTINSAVAIGANGAWAVTGDLTVNGAVSGAHSITKSGTGMLTLGGNNGFTGGTTVSAGTIAVGHDNALGTGTLKFQGGSGTIQSSSASAYTLANLVEMHQDTTIGGIGALDFTGTFTLKNNDHTLTIANTALTTFSGSTFSADNTRTLTIDVDSTSGGMLISSVVQDKDGKNAFTPTKIGGGKLTLSTANTYTGVTTVSGGVLLLNHATALPGGIDTTVGAGESALTINGGVVGLGVFDFTRGLGTGAGQVQFTGSGGFAAYNADRNVNLGGAGTPSLATWASGSFVPNGSALIFGASDADKTLTFQNPIALNGAVRTVQADNGAATVDAVLSGQLSGNSASGLTKTGTGTLSVTAPNTYGGPTTVSAGKLAVNNITGSGTGTGNVTVNSGATLGGIGTITGSVTNLSGSTISAGNSVGAFATGSEFWSGGGTNFWEINDVDAGAGVGWDVLNISGSLGITATSGDKFFIDIRSLTLGNAPGLVNDFDSSQSYIWAIAKTVGGVSFVFGESESTVFELLFGGFSNDLNGGTFSVSTSNGGNDLNVVFTPAEVPEPGTWAMMLLGLAGLWSAWRNRKSRP